MVGNMDCVYSSYYYFYLFFLLLPLYPLLEYFVQVCTHWSICKACRDKWESGAAKARSSPPVLTIREDVFQREQQAIAMKASSVNGSRRSSRRVVTSAKVVTFADDVAPRQRAGTDETGKFTNYDNLDEVGSKIPCTCAIALSN